MAEVDRLHESDELEAYFEERRLAFVNRYREEGREEGRGEGRAEERALLQRMATKRFGEEIEATLATFLQGVDDAERLADVGDWIVDCDTAAEFAARLDAGRSTIDTV